MMRDDKVRYYSLVAPDQPRELGQPAQIAFSAKSRSTLVFAESISHQRGQRLDRLRPIPAGRLDNDMAAL